MAAPIQNDSPLALDPRQSQPGGRPEGAEAGRPEPAPAERGAAAQGDSVSLSDAGRRLSDGPAAKGEGPRTAEQAQRLVEQLKEKLAANPGFAEAVHRASDSSRLASLLDRYA